jgi:hypothetical protein
MACQIRFYIRILFPPLIPNFNALLKDFEMLFAGHGDAPSLGWDL